MNARTNEWMFSDKPSVSVELIVQDCILVEFGRFLMTGFLEKQKMYNLHFFLSKKEDLHLCKVLCLGNSM